MIKILSPQDLTPDNSLVNSLQTAEKFISETIKNNKIVIFIKGSADVPACGFSERACSILKHYVTDFVTVNVLSNDFIRQGIKNFSNWPTIPQLFINGEFIGGSDIMSDMNHDGSLSKLISNSN
jgi:monothiol glutaredoxin